MKKEIIKKICNICGNEYIANVWYFNDRIISSDNCKQCQDKINTQEQLKNYDKKVNQCNINMRIKWIKDYGVTGKFLNSTFRDTKEELKLSEAYKVLKNYHGKSITLLSPNIYGLGKTYLVCALANYLIQNTNPVIEDRINFSISYKKCPVYFITESQMLDKIRSTFNAKNYDENLKTESEIYAYLVEIPLLIIDDIGKIKPNDLGFIQGVYYRIIDGRYTNNLPIIITTNLGYKELELHIGGASADRLKEMCGDNMLKMTGKSYR